MKVEAVALLACLAEERSSETWWRWSFTRWPWWMREREGATGERENERELARSSPSKRGARLRRSGAQVRREEATRQGSQGRVATEGGAQLCMVTTVLFLFHTLNDRSKPPQKYKLKLNLRSFLIPNTFSFGTNGSNKCCRAMRDLQHCLKDHGQI